MSRYLKIVIFALATILSSNASAVMIDGVPFKAQSPPGDWNHNMNCGPAAVLMMVAYYTNFAPTSEDIRRELDWLYERQIIAPQMVADAEYYDGNVTNVYNLRTLFRDFYFFESVTIRANGDRNLLEAELNKGNPVMVTVNIQMDPSRTGHFMVLLGMDGDQLTFHDPGKTLGSLVHYTWAQFDRSWSQSNRTSLVVDVAEPAVTWHPDGTLLKKNGDSHVYILINGQLFWILNEQVFNHHSFDWRRIITVSDEELACYPYGGQVNWQPYREIFELDNTIYFMEKNNANDLFCTTYRFVSEAAFNSWNLSGQIRTLNRVEANLRYFIPCSDGGNLYLRHGTIVKPTFAVPDFGQGAMFVATTNGVLLPFANWDVFVAMGYQQLPLMMINADQFRLSFNGYGEMITADLAATCLSGGGFVPSGGNEDVDADGDGIAVQAGDCDDYNSAISPWAMEVCDGLDNDCDSLIDEGALCPVNSICENGACQAIPVAPPVEVDEDGDGFTVSQGDCDDYNHWISPRAIEVCDSVDNDCDGLKNEGDLCPASTICENDACRLIPVAPPAEVDADGDGVSVSAGDCDDNNPAISPRNLEICDGLDNDCDDLTDEGNLCPAGFICENFHCQSEDIDLDRDGVSVEEGDCDDHNRLIGPYQMEVCDSKDNNCDGRIDEGNYCGAGAECVNGACQAIPVAPPAEVDADGDGVSVEAGDCNDNDPAISPRTVEVCDGKDNDCDSLTDEGSLCPANSVCENGACQALPVEPPPVDEPEDEVVCTITCPANMRAYAWYGSNGMERGNPLRLAITIASVCERGSPWVDFNCACTQPTEWFCFDWQVAQVTCNHEANIMLGRIDARGEGEIWFTDFACN